MSVALPHRLEGGHEIVVLSELLFRDHQSLESDEAARSASVPLPKASPIDGVSVDCVNAAQWQQTLPFRIECLVVLENQVDQLLAVHQP